MRVVHDELRQPIWNKPHIALVNGVWRVSKFRLEHSKIGGRWNRAQSFAILRNRDENRKHYWDN